MPSKTRKDYETEVRSWGFSHVFTWSDGPYVHSKPSIICSLNGGHWLGHFTHCATAPFRLLHTYIYTALETRGWHADNSNAHYRPHSHSGLTTHLIVAGELTITYPKDEEPAKTTFSVGDRVDVDAGRVHEVWIGKEGCTYVIGEWYRQSPWVPNKRKLGEERGKCISHHCQPRLDFIQWLPGDTPNAHDKWKPTGWSFASLLPVLTINSTILNMEIMIYSQFWSIRKATSRSTS